VDATPLIPLAAAVLHVPAPERALVIGCGDGEPALFLAREFPSARVRAVDRSARRVREAQARVGLDPEGRVAFKQAGSRSLPYPDEFFDLIAQVDGRAPAGEVARVLRPGGHFIHAPARPPRLATGLRGHLLEWRLAQHYFEVRQTGSAGDGNFLVARLDRGR
jgi:ubiquinone/menaquinone biosynthesis C-methylase UbiE